MQINYLDKYTRVVSRKASSASRDISKTLRGQHGEVSRARRMILVLGFMILLKAMCSSGTLAATTCQLVLPTTLKDNFLETLRQPAPNTLALSSQVVAFCCGVVFLHANQRKKKKKKVVVTTSCGAGQPLLSVCDAHRAGQVETSHIGPMVLSRATETQ